MGYYRNEEEPMTQSQRYGFVKELLSKKTNLTREEELLYQHYIETGDWLDKDNNLISQALLLEDKSKLLASTKKQLIECQQGIDDFKELSEHYTNLCSQLLPKVKKFINYVHNALTFCNNEEIQKTINNVYYEENGKLYTVTGVNYEDHIILRKNNTTNAKFWRLMSDEEKQQLELNDNDMKQVNDLSKEARHLDNINTHNGWMDWITFQV